MFFLISILNKELEANNSMELIVLLIVRFYCK